MNTDKIKDNTETYKTVRKSGYTHISEAFMGEKESPLLEKLMEDNNNEVFENRNDTFQVRSTNIFTSASKFCCLSELCPHFHI
jgi:hypothetical protein